MREGGRERGCEREEGRARESAGILAGYIGQFLSHLDFLCYTFINQPI